MKMETPILISNRTYTKKPDTNMFKMHSHETYEIYCFLKGSAKYFVEGNIYNLLPNDILIMKKAETHSLLINKAIPYERIVINFSSKAILNGLENKIIDFIEKRPLGKHNKYSAKKFQNNNWLYYLDKICTSDALIEQQLYLTALLNEMCRDYPIDTSNNEHSNINEIIEYINNNLFEDLSLDMLSANFYLSKAQLTRKFKMFTGATIWEYITTKRLIKAKELLNDGMPPTVVFTACGFNDYNTFYKAYIKHFGSSPKHAHIKRI